MIRSGATELTYDRTIQPFPKIGTWKDLLDEMLAVIRRGLHALKECLS